MKKVIEKITDIFEIRDKEGLAIIGINEDLDKFPIPYFDRFKNKELYFETSNESLVKIKILDVKVTNSLVDQKNIAFLIPISFRESLQLNSSVYED